jgi:hypothetical protein
LAANHYRKTQKGAVLLVMLIVIFTVTVLSIGFLSRSDVQLAVGENTVVRYQMDYLAESGMEYAKGIILSPQQLSSQYWTGVTAGQLTPDSNDYYDITVSKIGGMNYNVNCVAYREINSENVARSALKSELRIDPCIGYYQKDKKELPSQVTIEGDVYFGDEADIFGDIYGDVYSNKDIWVSFGANVTGGQNEYKSSPVNPPGISTADLSNVYYYNGGGPYSVKVISDSYEDSLPSPGTDNPAKVYYCNGNLELEDTININGTLIVKDDFKLKEDCNITIQPVKNMPALIVGHDIKNDDTYQTLSIDGYVQIGHHIDMHGKFGTNINIDGALYILGDGIMNTNGCNINITAHPDLAGLNFRTPSGTVNWNCAAGAFYKNLERVE